MNVGQSGAGTFVLAALFVSAGGVRLSEANCALGAHQCMRTFLLGVERIQTVEKAGPEADVRLGARLTRQNPANVLQHELAEIKRRPGLPTVGKKKRIRHPPKPPEEMET